MSVVFELVGPNKAVSVFGVKMVGLNAESVKKFALTLFLLLIFWILSKSLRWIMRALVHKRGDARTLFWSSQTINIGITILCGIVFISIWFDDPSRLATVLGLISAGLAFALQRVVTAISGYAIILRASLFNVGDRISIGGVRGDVIRVGFTHTTVMEMGQPPAVQMADPAMWVEARQYTGRIVTVTNDKIFDTPVFNYTRDFPYLWEEMTLKVPFESDRKKAEEIILSITNKNTLEISKLSQQVLQELERRYLVKPSLLKPKVFYKITDNWLELTVRFVTTEYGIRDLKDKMSREILEEFENAKIPIASTTVEVVGFPPIRIQPKS